jgi:hypothetical protein
MSLCNIPSWTFGFSIPGLPSFPSFSIPVFTLAVDIPCPLD